MIDHGVGVAVLGLVAVAVPIASGLHSRGAGRTDFSAAARPLPALRSAACVGGETLSAAAFLGATAVVLVHGTGALWVMSGLLAGYCLLTVLVAAPLRRSGVYSPSDFAEWRLGSRKVRRIVSACVVFAGWMYLVSQYLAAALLVGAFTGLPGWVGWLVLLGVTLVIVLGGGGGSGFQAAQFWVKFLALVVPAAVLASVWLLGAPARPPDLSTGPVFPAAHTVRADADHDLRVERTTRVTVTGELDGEPISGEPVTLRAGTHHVGGGTALSFAEGQPVPVHRPSGDGIGGIGPPHPDSAAGVLSMYVALTLGLIGIPQFIGRLSAARGAREARRTVVAVAGLLSAAMLGSLVLGLLAFDRAADVIATGRVDAVVLVLPQRLLPGPYGDAVTALVGAGAAVGVLSVSAALCRALGGTISQCMLGGGAVMFRVGAVMAMAVPALLVLLVPGLDRWSVLTPVLPALGLTAVTVAPMLLLGLWWRGLTAPGVAAGLLTGLSGIALSLAGQAGMVGVPELWDGLAAAPVALLVVLVTAVMVLVSLASKNRRPVAVEAMLTRMHVAPPALVVRERPLER